MKAQVFVEAGLVGIMTMLVGLLVTLVLSLLPKPKIESQWNKYYIMEIALFLTGVTIHLGCEFSGLNKYYCKHGAACKI
jgi:hypothetical protein